MQTEFPSMPTAWRGYAASGRSAVGAETACPRCTTDDYALLALKTVQICSHRQTRRLKQQQSLASPMFNIAHTACVLTLMLCRGPEDVYRLVNTAKNAGKRSVLMRIKSGDTAKFVALPIG
jgi:hypothetical protein